MLPSQLYTSFSPILLGLEGIAEMIWSELFHYTELRLNNLPKIMHKSDRVEMKTCVLWVTAQLPPLRAKCAEFWMRRNVSVVLFESLALVVLSHIPEWFGDGEIVLSDEGRHVMSTCSMSAFLSRLWSMLFYVPPHLLSTGILMENHFYLSSISWY